MAWNDAAPGEVCSACGNPWERYGCFIYKEPDGEVGGGSCNGPSFGLPAGPEREG